MLEGSVPHGVPDWAFFKQKYLAQGCGRSFTATGNGFYTSLAPCSECGSFIGWLVRYVEIGLRYCVPFCLPFCLLKESHTLLENVLKIRFALSRKSASYKKSFVISFGGPKAGCWDACSRSRVEFSFRPQTICLYTSDWCVTVCGSVSFLCSSQHDTAGCFQNPKFTQVSPRVHRASCQWTCFGNLSSWRLG